MTFKLRNWLAISSLLILWGCYPQGPEYTDDLDLVYTNYSTEFDFAAAKTYAIPDSVVKLTGDEFEDPDGNGRPTFANPAYANAILTTIKQNLDKNGWTMVNKNNNPNVIVLPMTTTTTNLFYYYDWGYWGWYYPGWYPGWGWYYPGYYPPYVSAYRTGSVFIQMVNKINVPSQGENIPVVWTCILNGLAEGSTSDLVLRIQTGIDKGFNQSPYLKH